MVSKKELRSRDSLYREHARLVDKMLTESLDESERGRLDFVRGQIDAFQAEDTELIQVIKEERDALAAKLADIGEILENSGCDCDCACYAPDGHEEDCDGQCLACRVQAVLLRRQARAQCPPPESTILKAGSVPPFIAVGMVIEVVSAPLVVVPGSVIVAELKDIGRMPMTENERKIVATLVSGSGAIHVVDTATLCKFSRLAQDFNTRLTYTGRWDTSGVRRWAEVAK